MIVYHHTRKSAFDAIRKSGGIASSRKIYHPAISARRKEHTEQPALWVLHEPYPRTWLKRSHGANAMEGLLEHTAKGEEPAILAIDIGGCRDLWAADYEEHMKDRREVGRAFFVSSRYQNSMRKFRSLADLEGMVVPEIICFDFDRAKGIELLPPMPVPVLRRRAQAGLSVRGLG